MLDHQIRGTRPERLGGDPVNIVYVLVVLILFVILLALLGVL
jgi:hypothetical protein